MKRWAFVAALSLGAAACGGGSAPEGGAAPADGVDGVAKKAGAATAATAPVPASAPAFVEVTIPAGTTLELALQSAVGSDTSAVEQAVTATIREAVTIDGRVVLPQGSELAGVVTDVERSGRVKGRARVAYRFNSVRAGDADYRIETDPIAHVAEATKGEDAKKVAIGAGAGAALGALLGGGDGAAKGAAIGGAGGAGVVLATRGDEARRASGAAVTTRLAAPVTVRVRR